MASARRQPDAADLPAYASLLRYGDDALVASNTAAACAHGYRHIKLHEVTREAVLAAQDASGADGARIMLDVNCAWSPPVAREMAAGTPRGWSALARGAGLAAGGR